MNETTVPEITRQWVRAWAPGVLFGVAIGLLISTAANPHSALSAACGVFVAACGNWILFREWRRDYAR